LRAIGVGEGITVESAGLFPSAFFPDIEANFFKLVEHLYSALICPAIRESIIYSEYDGLVMNLKNGKGSSKSGVWWDSQHRLSGDMVRRSKKTSKTTVKVEHLSEPIKSEKRNFGSISKAMEEKASESPGALLDEIAIQVAAIETGTSPPIAVDSESPAVAVNPSIASSRNHRMQNLTPPEAAHMEVHIANQVWSSTHRHESDRTQTCTQYEGNYGDNHRHFSSSAELIHNGGDILNRNQRSPIEDFVAAASDLEMEPTRRSIYEGIMSDTQTPSAAPPDEEGDAE
jgi:hypothetical protein